MARLPEILRRNRQQMRALLAELVVPPWEAEPMLVEIVESLPRQVWEGLSQPDDVLFALLRQECLRFDALRRQGRTSALLMEWESPRGREFACL
jgi:hypothetical protein